MMRIAQVVLPNASSYERKSQRIDQAELRAKHDVLHAALDQLSDTAADVVHFYGNDLAGSALARLRLPYVASVEPRRGRLTLRKPPPPRYVLSPLAPIDPDSPLQNLPEAVEEQFFHADETPSSDLHRVGSYLRPAIRNLVDQTMHRLGRTRDDIRWLLFDREPSREDLRSVDLWVDPAVADDDFDGWVAEAIAAGKAVVASRTPINNQRLEKGRTGLLVPPGDPNELTHAILTALFKSEVAELKIEAARQTAGKFRPRQRLRVLERIYETLVP
jgi:glycosyltransferase involved in cell wall biosynthesis